MIICHCNAVSDHTIREVVVDLGVESRAEVAAVCGAGGDCGGCRRSIDRIIDQCRPAPVLIDLAS